MPQNFVVSIVTPSLPGLPPMMLLGLQDGPESYPDCVSNLPKFCVDAPHEFILCSGLPHIDLEGAQSFASGVLTMQEQAEDGKQSLLTVFSEIGRGHFGSVYFGIFQNRACAVKIVPTPDPDCTSPRALQLTREMLFAALPPHRNVVPIRTAFSQSGFTYLVMDYCDGGRLSDVLNYHRKQCTHLQFEDISSILLQLARAIRFLHHRGIIHRDIKPDNIMFSSRHPRPLSLQASSLINPSLHPVDAPSFPAIVSAPLSSYRVRLCDHGLARSCEGYTGLTVQRPGLTIGAGTSYWMAPEMLRSDGHYGFASDIFSLGMLALELVTLQKPAAFRHPGSPVDARAVRYSLPSSLPPFFTSLILSCLSPSPELRPSSGRIVSALKGCTAPVE